MHKGPVDDNFIKLGQGVQTGCCFFLTCEAEARHMYCFSIVMGGGGGLNFCQVFVFRLFSQKI